MLAPPGNTITDFKTKTKHTRLSRLATSSGLKLSRLSRQLANPPIRNPPLLYPSQSIIMLHWKSLLPPSLYVYVHFHFRDLFALRMARVEAGLARLLSCPLARPLARRPPLQLPFSFLESSLSTHTVTFYRLPANFIIIETFFAKSCIYFLGQSPREEEGVGERGIWKYLGIIQYKPRRVCR